jgi:hypothetical protein
VQTATGLPWPAALAESCYQMPGMGVSEDIDAWVITGRRDAW